MTLPKFVRRRFLSVAGALAVLLAAGVLQLAAANPAASQTLALTAYQSDQDPGLNPKADAWDRAVHVQVPLTAQGATYPTGGGSVPVISARALHYQGKLYVLVEWQDDTRDDSTVKVQDFADAVAVEFPARSASTVPSICMGQADGGVNIWQWRADSQRGIKDPADLYASALVDMYPSKEDVFYTARAAGNVYANPLQGPVQTLVSRAFGTLSPADVQDVKGEGAYTDGKWAVVFARQFAGANSDQAAFSAGSTTDIAFAVWNGSQGDRNGRKSISQFVQLKISGLAVPGAGETNKAVIWIAVGLVLGTTALGLGLATYGYREGRGK